MPWFNGTLCDGGQVRIDPADRGLLLGDGVFETVRGQNGTAPHLARHLARLRDAAVLLGIPLPFDDAAITAAVHAVLAHDAPAAAALRITLTRGPAPRGVLPPEAPSPTLLITASTLPPAPAPAHVIIARQTTRNAASPLSRVKSLNYLDSVIARREAAARGADDAVLLNTDGIVAEATAATIFVIHGDRVTTPRVTDGALPGIYRARVIEAGLAAEATITPAALAAADGAFLGNSLGIRRITAVDQRPLPWPAPAQALFGLMPDP